MLHESGDKKSHLPRTSILFTYLWCSVRIPKSYPIIAPRQLAYMLSGTPPTCRPGGLGDKKEVTDLADEMIVARSIEITVQSKVAKCFPWGFIGVDGLASVG